MFNKLIKLLSKNKLLLSIVIGILLFITYIFFLKTPNSSNQNIYVKIKLNQGLWWSVNVKPGIWFIDYLKKGEKEYDFLKRPIAELIAVRYYHQQNNDSNQFDIYIIAKLSVTKVNDYYFFKRAKIAVGAPIDLDFPSSQVTGTIVAFSSTRTDNILIERNITLTKKFAFPWEYDAISIGDKYFDGEDNILEIIDKTAFNTELLTTDYYGNNNPTVLETRKFIIVKAKIKLRKNIQNQLIFGEEQVIKKNSYANLTTNNYILRDFIISDIN